MALRRFPYVLGLCGVIVLMRCAHDASPGDLDLLHNAQIHWTTAQVGIR